MDWQPRFCPTNSKLDKGYCCGRVEMRFTLTKLNSCSLSRRVEIGVVLQVQIEELSPRTLTALPETGITIEWATSWLGSFQKMMEPPRLLQQPQGRLAGEGQPAWASREGLASSCGINLYPRETCGLEPPGKSFMQWYSFCVCSLGFCVEIFIPSSLRHMIGRSVGCPVLSLPSQPGYGDLGRACTPAASMRQLTSG